MTKLKVSYNNTIVQNSPATHKSTRIDFVLNNSETKELGFFKNCTINRQSLIMYYIMLFLDATASLESKLCKWTPV